MRYDPKFEFNVDTQNYELMGPKFEQVRQDLILAFHKDVEGKIRRALIDMGWTPPSDTHAPSRQPPE